MTIGTEGNDDLTNDPAVNQEMVDALGGNDVVNIVTPANALSGSTSVDVLGGAGSDTLIVNMPGQRIQLLGGSGLDGSANFRLGLGMSWGLTWSSIERLEITAALFAGSGGFPGGLQFSTGGSVDILRFGTPNSNRGNSATISTNGGNDEIYISGRPVADGGSTITVNAGTGDDLIDFSAVEMTGGALGWFGNGGDGQDRLIGSPFRDTLRGDAGHDSLQLWIRIPASTTDAATGGSDVAEGGAGNDSFFFGAALTAGDVVTGGADYDTLVIQGDYAGGLTLSANVTEIEALSILAGTNTNFGESGANRYDYVITTNDANFASGLQAKINGANLAPGEDFTFNGAAETGAGFVVYGSRNVDTLTGGFGHDIFFYAEERFAPGDTVNGGPGGYDGLFLRGNYTIDFNAPGYHGLLTSIENITLSSATDERYARGGGTEFDYNVTLADSHLAAGVELTVSGTLLMATETMVVDAGLESDGRLRLFGGKAADTLKGGGQADLIHGNLGADQLTGNGGADIFRYDSTAESTNSSLDQILDFTPGTDKIDLSRIDADTVAAGDQAFRWIGSNAFSGTAGELRAENLNGLGWFLEGDTDGNGSADFVVMLTLQGQVPLGAGDFIL